MPSASETKRERHCRELDVPSSCSRLPLFSSLAFLFLVCFFFYSRRNNDDLLSTALLPLRRDDGALGKKRLTAPRWLLRQYLGRRPCHHLAAAERGGLLAEFAASRVAEREAHLESKSSTEDENKDDADEEAKNGHGEKARAYEAKKAKKKRRNKWKRKRRRKGAGGKEEAASQVDAQEMEVEGPQAKKEEKAFLFPSSPRNIDTARFPKKPVKKRLTVFRDRGTQAYVSSSRLFLMYLIVSPILALTNSSGHVFAMAATQDSDDDARHAWLENSSLDLTRQRLQGSQEMETEFWPPRYEGVKSPETAKVNERSLPVYDLAISDYNYWGSCTPPGAAASGSCPGPCPLERAFETLIDKFGLVKRLKKDDWKRRRRRKRNKEGTSGSAKRTIPRQCLFYLEESHMAEICHEDFGRDSPLSFLTPRENRYWFMAGLRLRHCCEHTVVNALAPGMGGQLENVLNGGTKCIKSLTELFQLDVNAARTHCVFEDVLARYDCAQPYSVIFNCSHCKEAYRKWMCSSQVPYFAHGEPVIVDKRFEIRSWTRLQPCRAFCQTVEQRCPYLLPGDRAPAYPTQYAGEPTFLCRVE